MPQSYRKNTNTNTHTKLSQIYRYVQAFNYLQNPIVQNMQAYTWALNLRDLPEHRCIQLGMSYNMSKADDDSAQNYLLKVRRPDPIDVPAPPRELFSYIRRGWESIEGTVDLTPAGVSSLRSDARLVRLYEKWKDQRTQYCEREKASHQTMSLYEKLSALRADLEREAENKELVLGDGILKWPLSDRTTSIDHPLLTIHLQLLFDPQIPEFILKESEQPPELYTALFQTIPDINISALGPIRQDFEQHRFHPLHSNDTSQFFQRLLNQLSFKNEFAEHPHLLKSKSLPSITRNPVIFVRKRTQGFHTAIEAILDDIPKREDLPYSLTSLVGLTDLDTNQPHNTQVFTEPSLNGEDEHILLSKAANAEQLAIAQQLDCHGAVLVQGPPGTGKTHTIANLLGHLLAQGKSVLVTSHTSKALRVLHEKVVEPLQPLCVSILDDENRKHMERAIDAISDRLSSSNEALLEREATTLTRRRLDVLQQLKGARHELKIARNTEYEPIVYLGKQFTPTEAARYVTKLRDSASWLPLPISPGAPLPLSTSDVLHLYRTNSAISMQEEQEVLGGLPDVNSLPSPVEVSFLFQEQTALENENIQHKKYLWSSSYTETFDPAFFATFSYKLERAIDILQNPAAWQLQAIAAGREGGLRRKSWEDFIQKIETIYTQALQFEHLILEYNPSLPDNCLPDRIENVLQSIIDCIASGKKLTSLFLLTRRDWKTVIEKALVNGKRPETLAHFQALLALTQLKTARADLVSRWQRQMTVYGAPDAGALGEKPEARCKQFVYPIQQCLNWYVNTWEPLELQLKQQGFDWQRFIGEMPTQLIEHAEILCLKDAALKYLPGILLAEQQRRQHFIYKSQLQKIQLQLRSIGTSAAQTSVIKQLQLSVANADAQLYRDAIERLSALNEKRKIWEHRTALLAKLEKSAPTWAAAIRRREGIHAHDEPPGNADDAWLCYQLSIELDRRNATSLGEVQDRITRLITSLHATTAELVEKKAWAAQVRRTTGEQRQALNGWKELMRKVGKGTGKRAPKLLAEARQLMPKCQAAVPVWIMPLSRVVQNFDPRTNRFDVVIIDEASQSDVKALTAMYMAKQIMIVGDDEQVTPLAVGQKVDNVEQLIAEHLQDIPLSAMYDGKLSIYQLAKTAPGFKPISLREHFRCVSPIIQFSNMLSYNGKIKALRDDSDVLRRPPTIAYRVASQDISASVNEIEAQTVASLLVASTEQPEYQDATFGVISMLDEKQALRIDSLLNRYLSPTEYTRRRILCGNAAQFQGDERDVMFLSLVDVPKDGPLTLHHEDSNDYMYKKRFNVAASRARDQLWVVHSLNPKVDLKDGDIRKKLIEYAENPTRFEQQLAIHEQKVESEFERQVLKRLLSAGYRVTPQWQVGAYRIDLVVEAHGRRLAVECDGDRWHSFDKIDDDIARQTILERLGWRFVRIRGSQFFRDPEKAMDIVFARLRELDISPIGSATTDDPSASAQELQNRIIMRAAELRQSWFGNQAPSFLSTRTSSKSRTFN